MGKAEIEKDPSLQILEKVSKWLPPSIVDQLKKKSLTPVDIIRLLSLLPPESRDNFASVPDAILVFPRDHNMHMMQNHEHYSLALNLKGKNNGKRYGAFSSIARHTLNAPIAALFAPMKYNQVFRSSFSLTSTSGDSDESSKKDIHYYVGDQGGYLGDYRPAVVGKLPACSWDNGKQGLIPPVNEDGESIKGKMMWIIKGEVKGQPCGFKLELTPKSPILLNGPSGKGTLSNPSFGSSYMYYSFPYLEAKGILVLPDGTEEEVHGSGWLDHKGGVQKSADVNVTYLMQWKHFLKQKIHRPAWISTMVQFPQPSYKLFLNGSVILKNPSLLEEGQVLPWVGNMQLDGRSTEVKGKCKVVEIFESPTLENVRYTTQLILRLAGVMEEDEDLVVEIKSIYRDQRVFPADQSEIYEGAAEAVLLSARGTAKPQGTGFIENMAFSSMEQLEKQQYDSLGIAPTVGNMQDMFKREVGASTSMSTTGPVVTIVLFLLCVAIALGIYFKKNKK